MTVDIPTIYICNNPTWIIVVNPYPYSYKLQFELQSQSPPTVAFIV